MGYKNWKIESYNVTSPWASKCFLIKPHAHPTAVPLESARNSLHNPILEYNGQNKKIDFSKTKSLKSFNLTELIFYK